MNIMPPLAPSPMELDALQRLVRVAMKNTGQARRVADFLLAWWNAEECGGFDLTDLWGVDQAIATDMVAVFTLIAHQHHYPPFINPELEADFRTLFKQWRSQP